MACVRSMRHGIRPRPASYQRFTGEKVAEPDYGFGGGICVRWLARHPAAHVTPGGVDLSETSGIAPWRDFGAPGGQGAALRYPLRRTAYDAPSDTATCRPSGRHVYGMIPGPRRFALSTRWQRIPRRVDAPRTDGGRVRCLRRPGDPFTGSAVPIARRLPTRRASDGRCGDVGGTLTRHRGGGHEGLRRHGSRHFGSCERQFSRRRKRQLVSPTTSPHPPPRFPIVHPATNTTHAPTRSAHLLRISTLSYDILPPHATGVGSPPRSRRACTSRGCTSRPRCNGARYRLGARKRGRGGKHSNTGSLTSRPRHPRRRVPGDSERPPPPLQAHPLASGSAREAVLWRMEHSAPAGVMGLLGTPANGASRDANGAVVGAEEKLRLLEARMMGSAAPTLHNGWNSMPAGGSRSRTHHSDICPYIPKPVVLRRKKGGVLTVRRRLLARRLVGSVTNRA